MLGDQLGQCTGKERLASRVGYCVRDAGHTPGGSGISSYVDSLSGEEVDSSACLGE